MTLCLILCFILKSNQAGQKDNPVNKLLIETWENNSVNYSNKVDVVACGMIHRDVMMIICAKIFKIHPDKTKIKLGQNFVIVKRGNDSENLNSLL